MKLKNNICFFFLLLFTVQIVYAPSAWGQTPHFIKIVDAKTTIPFHSGLSSFGVPSISNGYVAFTASNESYTGIFHTKARSFTKLADTDTAVPESSGTFTELGPPAFSSLYGTFVGTGSSQSGIYLGYGGPLPEKVVATGDLVPGAPSSFSEFYEPSIDYDSMTLKGQVVFRAIDTGFLHGIYAYGIGEDNDGVLIADTATQVPGHFGDLFESFYDPVIDSGVIAFSAMSQASGISGIYRYSDSLGLKTVAETGTLIPGRFDFFWNFGFLFSNKPVATGDGDVVFQGNTAGGHQGIYASINGRLQVIADLTTAAPGSSGHFSLFEFYPPAISSGNVVFNAYDDSNQLALYAHMNGNLLRIIGSGDELDRKSVMRVETGAQALDGKFLAFHVTFSDNSEAIYLAAFDIAEPASADINGDGIVDLKDFFAVLLELGPCPQPDNCPGDLDGNGVVNFQDLLEVLANLGPADDGPLQNDECEGAVVISSGGTSFSTAGATSSEILLPPPYVPGGWFSALTRLDCDEGSGLDFHNDIWFSFVPPETCDVLTVNTCNKADFDTRLGIYALLSEHSDWCGFMQPIGCNDDSPGCNMGSLAAVYPWWVLCRGIGQCDPSPYPIYIRVGSKDPDGYGTGRLVVACEPRQGDSHDIGSSPDKCEFPIAQFEGDETVFDYNVNDSPVPGYRGVFDDTPGCGDGDSTDAWHCFTSPCTGLVSASVGAMAWFATPLPSVQLVTVSVFSDPGMEMLSCGSNDSGDARPKITTYWGAVTGHRYLIRVGFFPESFDLRYKLKIKCEEGGSICGWPYTNTCFTDNPGIPGCDDGLCCARICEIDSYCCSIEWDDSCASRANRLCNPNQQYCADIFSDETCYEAHDSPGCKTSDCCETVCRIDPSCCDINWDRTCVQTAVDVCTAPACPVVNTSVSCFETSMVPGCMDSACCGRVCEVDPLCCDLDWSYACVVLAETLCERSE